MESNAADCRRPDEAEEEDDDDLGRRPDEAEAEDDLGRQPDEAEEDGDDDSVLPVSGLCWSKHGDGSIYSGRHFFQRFFHLADTRETLLDAMMLCNPTDCRPCISMCKLHRATAMMQIFSLKLVETGVAADDRPIRLYGFLAVRDSLNPLRNYIFNHTREDPLVLGQHQQGSSHPGSFILPMAGPKRGIQMRTCVLIEYDLKAKRGGEKEDDDDSNDLQLVDGAGTFSEVTSIERCVYTRRIKGDCGVLEISYALLRSAVEATVEVWVEQRHGSALHLSLSCSVSQIPQKIELFQSAVAGPCRLNRSVVAVVQGSALIVFLTAEPSGGSADRAVRAYAFFAKLHGLGMEVFELGFATIRVKVYWSALVSPTVARQLL